MLPIDPPNVAERIHPDIGNYHDGQGRDFTLLAVYLNHGELWAHYINTDTKEEYNATLASFKLRFSRKP